MANPPELRYTESHEWLRQESDGTLTVGITAHAQDELGELVYVELPDVGRVLAGTVTAVNDDLPGAPQKVNEEPFGGGWLFRIEPANAGDFGKLMSADDYERSIGA